MTATLALALLLALALVAIYAPADPWWRLPLRGPSHTVRVGASPPRPALGPPRAAGFFARGLAIDARILVAHLGGTLRAGGASLRAGCADVFFEHVAVADVARRPGALLVNHEVLSTADVARMRRGAVAVALVKTDTGARAVAALCPGVRQVRVPMYTPCAMRAGERIHKDIGCAIHLAGHSWMKGTEAVARAWAPDMPRLLITCSPKAALFHGAAIARAPRNVCAAMALERAEVLAALRRCAIAVLPSACEGWSHAIREAMACGCIVITCDRPPMNEAVRHMETGILVPMHDSVRIPVWAAYGASARPADAGGARLPAPARVAEAVRAVQRMAPAERARIAQNAHDAWAAHTAAAIAAWPRAAAELAEAVG